MFCPKCGTRVIDQAKFCPKCGFAFNIGEKNIRPADPASGKSNIVGSHSSPDYSEDHNGEQGEETGIVTASNISGTSQGIYGNNPEPVQNKYPAAVMYLEGSFSQTLCLYEDRLVICKTGAMSSSDTPIPYKDIATVDFSVQNDGTGCRIRFYIPGLSEKLINPLKSKFNLSVSFPFSKIKQAEELFGMLDEKVTESRTGRKVFSNRVSVNNVVDPLNAVKIGCLYPPAANKQKDIVLNVNDLTAHTFVTGSTGSGKSNTVYRLLQAVLQRNGTLSAESQVHYMVIEPAKGEYKDQFRDAVVYGTNREYSNLLRINPFSFPDKIHVLEHIDRLCEIFTACWPMSAAMPQILRQAVENAYVITGWDLQDSTCIIKGRPRKLFPTFLDVLDQISAIIDQSDFSGETKGDYIGALSSRVRSLTTGNYAQILTCDDLSDSDLFNENVIIDLSRLGNGDTRSLLMGLIVLKLQEYCMSERDQGRISDNSPLRHLVVIEEAHNLLRASSSERSADVGNMQGMSVQMLSNIIAEMRTYGEGFVIVDQAPGLLDRSVIRNTNTKIIHRLPGDSDRKLVGKAASLSDAQIDELAHLETGVAAIFQNNWSQPVLCKVDRAESPNPDSEKVVINYAPYRYDIELVHFLLDSVGRDDADLEAEWNYAISRASCDAKTKRKMLNYLYEKNPERRDKLQRELLGDLFNSHQAIVMSMQFEDDYENWRDNMQKVVVPSLNHFDEDEQNLILQGIIMSEYRRGSEDEELLNFLKEIVPGLDFDKDEEDTNTDAG